MKRDIVGKRKKLAFGSKDLSQCPFAYPTKTAAALTHSDKWQPSPFNEVDYTFEKTKRVYCQR